MEIDYKKLLVKYCGSSIVEYAEEWGEDVYKINGEEKELVLCCFSIYIKKNKSFEDELKVIVSVFDIIFENTDEVGMGTIIDFEYNKVILFFSDIQKSIDSIKKAIKLVSSKYNNIIDIMCTLHVGNVFYGNWGSKKRFKRMIYGFEFEYCKKVNSILFNNNKINCVVTEDYYTRITNKKYFNEIIEIGEIRFENENKGKLYSFNILNYK